MRFIKLSTDEFPTEEDLQEYFSDELPSREPPGRFVFPMGRIGEDGLRAGETLVFTYEARIRYVAEAKTGVLKNADDPETAEYPVYFVINMETLRPTDVPLQKLEELLAREKIYSKNLVHSQAWVPIQHDTRAQELLEGLIAKQGTAK